MVPPNTSPPVLLMKLTIAPGVLEPNRGELPPRTTSIRSILVSKRNRLSAFMKKVCIVGKTGIPSSRNATYSTPRMPRMRDVLIDLTAGALDPGEARDVAEHLGRAPRRRRLDLAGGQSSDGNAGIQIHPRRLSAGDHHGLQLERVAAESEVMHGSLSNTHLDRCRLRPVPEQARLERVAAGGNSREHVLTVGAGLRAHGRARNSHLGADERCSLVIDHGPRDAAGLVPLCGCGGCSTSGESEQAGGGQTDGATQGCQTSGTRAPDHIASSNF